MRILLDRAANRQGTPVPLRRHLIDHSVETTYERGWSDVKNGELLTLAEQNEFELLITTDQNLRYQQNLSNRKLAILVLMSTSWPRIQSKISVIQQTVSKINLGEYQEIII